MSQRKDNLPDKYCITLADGSCVSDHPDCMHQPKTSDWILERDGKTLYANGRTITIEGNNLHIDCGEYLDVIPLAGLYTLLARHKREK